MPKDLFCIPTAKTAVPAGPDWIHEVKYDGYRLRVERNGDRVRCFPRAAWTGPSGTPGSSRRHGRSASLGSSWTAKPSCSASTGSPTSRPCTLANMMRRSSYTLSTAWRITATTSPAYRCICGRLTWSSCCAAGSDGIFVAQFEHGEIGPALFDAACRMGLEGLVSKHRERPYRAGRCDHWLKVKNRKHSAFTRVADQF